MKTGLTMAHTKKTNKPIPILIGLALTALFTAVMVVLSRDVDIPLLDPKGLVANEQHWLLITSTLIMLAFGIPVILTLYFFTWKYREDNPDATYSPNKNSSKAMLAFSWGGPFIIVAILACLLVPATYRLVPQEPIVTGKDQLTIQVVSMNWKWLFIYPEQEIATINFAQIPVDTPIRFELTADEAPMSSFWVPHLAGMLYTMTGHVNPLHLVADTVGDYPGASAEINGNGFAGMKFTTRVSTEEDFEVWVNEVKQSPNHLNDATYKELLKPSEYDEPAFYASTTPNLYDNIVGKYNSDHSHAGAHEGHGSY